MSKNWWEDFFEDTFADFFLERDQKNLEEARAFLFKTLSLKEGMVLFDQCCGVGNISHILARSGIKTIGVEQSGEYVRLAKEIAIEEHLSCEFFQGDALTFLPLEKCDAAINWYTSFGYSLDDNVNLKMLQMAYEALKNGGVFALDFHNIPFVLQQPQSTRQIRKNKAGNECVVTRTSIFNLEEGSYLSKWAYEYLDGTVKNKEGTTRVYLPHQLKAMLLDVGFTSIQFFGDTDCAPLTVDSPRCFLIARK